MKLDGLTSHALIEPTPTVGRDTLGTNADGDWPFGAPYADTLRNLWWPADPPAGRHGRHLGPLTLRRPLRSSLVSPGHHDQTGTFTLSDKGDVTLDKATACS